MMKLDKPRLLIDADVLVAGAASPNANSASLVVLRMAEITLIEAIVPEQVIVEVERTLELKLPKARSAFHLLMERCLTVVSDPRSAEVASYRGLADPQDLPILVTALRERCPWLVTFNVRHYQPGHPDVLIMRPGEFILQVRDLLARFAALRGDF